MPDFPSARFFDELAAAAARHRDEFEDLGFCDLRLALRVNSPDAISHFGLKLAGFDVESDGEVDPESWGADCTLEGPIFVWQEMIDNIAENGRADSQHTLNSLTLADFPMRVTCVDIMGHDRFFRYNETLQRVFDLASEVADHPVAS